MERVSIGIDFGTLSARAAAVRVSDGHVLGSASFDYPHGVMDSELQTPSGAVSLPPDWALQDPADYLEALRRAVTGALNDAGLAAESVIGIGVDFTTCTMIAADADGMPLCFDVKFASEPHAYAKLWKHHASSRYAKLIEDAAKESGEPWLFRLGGKVSCEWLFPKMMQVLKEAPRVYEAADSFIDAADWIVRLLTGSRVRNSCTAGYKAFWTEEGYPSPGFLAKLDPRLENCVVEKLGGVIVAPGTLAGTLTKEGAALCGLLPGTAVSAGCGDAHAAAPALKITGPGTMLCIMGTSAAMLVSTGKYTDMPGICGFVKDGFVPGYWGCEAGLACFGDLFAWFAKNCASEDIIREAKERGVSALELLSEKAALLRPGECGVIALNWWNGNRSPIGSSELTGMFAGMSLSTTCVDMFRALEEATAFGTRMILENLGRYGVGVERIIVSGGIPRKNPALMQIFADVLGRKIETADVSGGSDLGSAVYGALAAGAERGGYGSYEEAALAMGRDCVTAYLPDAKAHAVYEKIYREYLRAAEFFSGCGIMKELSDLSRGAG